jgi:hypothetical protein
MFPNNLSETPLSPLLTHETLRRVAWAVFFSDSILDGGRYGSGLVDINKFYIQLPCNEQSFLGNDNSKTESIFAPPSGATGLSGYIIRCVLLRRRAMDIFHRLSHDDYQLSNIEADLAAVEASVAEMTSSLPARYHFTADNTYLHRKRLPAFLLVHIMLHMLYNGTGSIKLRLYKKDSRLEHLIPDVRRQRITHALAVSAIFAEGLKLTKIFCLHAAAVAYIVLESKS